MAKRRWTSDDMPDQTGRTAIVTGGNSGIGYEAVKALAAAGATVVIASRDETRGANAVSNIIGAVDRARVELLLLDLADLSSVKAFVARFLERHDRLDLLINNAGVMMPPERKETADGFELQFGTNHLGHFALTIELLSMLVKREGSRVVNVSSSAQGFGHLDLDDLQWKKRKYDRMRSYGASKIANMLFSLELQRRLDHAGAPTMVTSCHPGWTSTNLQQSSPVLRLLNPLFGMKPWQGALPTLYAATSSDAVPNGYYGPDGLGTVRGYPTRNEPAPASKDREVARRLWEQSQDLTNVSMPKLDVESGSAKTG